MNKREIVGYALYQIGKFGRKEPDFLSIYFHDPAPKTFTSILEWCKKKSYRFITLQECYAILSGKIRQEGKVAYLSFDDGWQSNLNLIPIIDKYQAPITIFVSIDPLLSGNFWWEYALADGIELRNKMKLMSYKKFVSSLESLKKKYSLERSVLTEQELVKIASHPLVSIQSHTMSHPILTNCDDEILSYELNSSKAYLENLLHHKIEAFSYPNGNFSNREIEAVKKAGYKMAFTTEYIPIQINHTNLYRIPHMAMNTYGGYYENLSKILGIWQDILKK